MTHNFCFLRPEPQEPSALTTLEPHGSEISAPAEARNPLSPTPTAGDVFDFVMSEDDDGPSDENEDDAESIADHDDELATNELSDEDFRKQFKKQIEPDEDLSPFVIVSTNADPYYMRRVKDTVCTKKNAVAHVKGRVVGKQRNSDTGSVRYVVSAVSACKIVRHYGTFFDLDFL
jgi:hypothetical protein